MIYDCQNGIAVSKGNFDEIDGDKYLDNIKIIRNVMFDMKKYDNSGPGPGEAGGRGDEPGGPGRPGRRASR